MASSSHYKVMYSERCKNLLQQLPPNHTSVHPRQGLCTRFSCQDPHLIEITRRPQQSGFTASHFTIDTILALLLLSYLQSEFNRPLHATYLDIKSAFDSVDQNALWKALWGRGVPYFLLKLIKSLHERTGTRIRCGRETSHRFPTTSGVRQGCIRAPILLSVAIYWILNHMAEKPELSFSQRSFSDIAHADNTEFLVKSAVEAFKCLTSFKESAAPLSICIPWSKKKNPKPEHRLEPTASH